MIRISGALRRTAAFVFAAGLSLLAATQGRAQTALLDIQREGQPVVALTPERFASLPRITLKVTQKTGRGEEIAEWSGTLLWGALVAVGAIDAERHAEHVRLAIRATGKDGYVAVVALGELAPEFENKAVLIADRLNGSALPGGAVRLIVPGDKRAGRGVRDLVRLEIGR